MTIKQVICDSEEGGVAHYSDLIKRQGSMRHKMVRKQWLGLGQLLSLSFEPEVNLAPASEDAHNLNVEI